MCCVEITQPYAQFPLFSLSWNSCSDGLSRNVLNSKKLKSKPGLLDLDFRGTNLWTFRKIGFLFLFFLNQLVLRAPGLRENATQCPRLTFNKLQFVPSLFLFSFIQLTCCFLRWKLFLFVMAAFRYEHRRPGLPVRRRRLRRRDPRLLSAGERR